MKSFPIHDDIANFLSANPKKWFTSQEIATGIGRQGKQITSQLDTMVIRHDYIFRETVWIKPRQKRLYYGWFDSEKKALESRLI